MKRVQDGCGFHLRHFEELLEAAQAAGYRFVDFSREPEPGDLLLRHDVDLSLEAALRMARLEEGLGVRATYFLMTESVFYNLASPVGVRALEQLRSLGHAVGLHAVWPRAQLDDRFDPVVAWHNPDPDFMSAPLDGVANVMEPRFFDPAWYRSDSNQRWRHGCPHEAIARRDLERVHLLVHPEIWVYPGETMRESMLAFLDDERETRLTYLAHDRIDLS